MKPQPIATAPTNGAFVLAFCPSLGQWITGNRSLDGASFYSLTGGTPYLVTHWLPLPEPPTPKQAYVFLTEGDVVQEGDEFFHHANSKWEAVPPYCVGTTLPAGYQPHRRAVHNNVMEQPQPATPEQYRMLEEGEIIKYGDEYDYGDGDWRIRTARIGQPYDRTLLKTRRRIPNPEP